MERRTMTRISKNRLIMVALAFLISFIPLSALAGPKNLIEFLIGPIITLSIAVIYIYWPGVKDAFKLGQREMDPADLIILGLILILSALACRFIYSWYWRLFGNGNVALLTNIFIAFLFWMTFTGLLMLLSAPRTIKNEIPRMNWRRVGLILSAGCVLGFAATAFF